MYLVLKNYIKHSGWLSKHVLESPVVGEGSLILNKKYVVFVFLKNDKTIDGFMSEKYHM